MLIITKSTKSVSQLVFKSSNENKFFTRVRVILLKKNSKQNRLRKMNLQVNTSDCMSK